jgi:hypothetical protein
VDQVRRNALLEAIVASLVVTGLVTLGSRFLPEKYVATGVGLVFLVATWALVWRRDDEFVVRSGLAMRERPRGTPCAHLAGRSLSAR